MYHTRLLRLMRLSVNAQFELATNCELLFFPVLACLRAAAGMIVTNQWVQFSVSTPTQAAVATALEEVCARVAIGFCSLRADT